MLRELSETREELKINVKIHAYWDFERGDLQSCFWHRRHRICHRCIRLRDKYPWERRPRLVFDPLDCGLSSMLELDVLRFLSI